MFLPTPEAYDNTSDDGKAKLEEVYNQDLDNLWPVSWQIEGWTTYTFDQMKACKGPRVGRRPLVALICTHRGGRRPPAPPRLERDNMTLTATDLLLEATDVAKTYGAVVA